MQKNVIFFLCLFCAGLLVGFSREIFLYATYGNPQRLARLRRSELKAALKIMVEREPFDRVVLMIKRAFPKEEPWMHNDVAHVLGELLYKKYGLQSFGMCESFFNEGCYHGIVELIGRIHGPDPMLFKKLKDVCDAAKDYKLCSHPLGHAAMMLADYDVLKALHTCDEYYSEERIAFQCWFGAIMEYNAEVALKAGDQEEKVLSLCRQYPEQYQGACIQLQLHHLSFLWKNDFVRLANHCRTFATRELVDMCADEFGFVIAGYNYFSDPPKAVSTCDEFPDLRDWCLTGIIRTYRTNNRRDIAQSVCDMLHDEELRRYCL